MCFTIALHAFSHLRPSSAHAFMCLSSGNASHALAHWSHDFTQESQIRTECGPPLETICAAAAQTVAQSWQFAKDFRCSFLPSASRCAQWVAQESHARWQSEQALAHACIIAL